MPADKIFIVDRAENMHLKCVSLSARVTFLSLGRRGEKRVPAAALSQHPLFQRAAGEFLFIRCGGILRGTAFHSVR